MKTEMDYIALKNRNVTVRLMPAQEDSFWLSTGNTVMYEMKHNLKNTYNPIQTNIKDCEVHASNLNLMNPSLTKENAYEVKPEFPHDETEYSLKDKPMEH